MRLEFVLSAECFSTSSALEWFLSCVRAPVAAEVRGARELGLAELAGERLSQQVSVQMAAQVGEVGAVLAAQWASGEW